MTLADLLGWAQSGARGFTTGLLGGPVDIANIMLGGAGGQSPVMGSQWIGDKLQGAGLLAPAATDLPGSAAEFAGGFINPMGVAAKTAAMLKPLTAAAILAKAEPAAAGASKAKKAAQDLSIMPELAERYPLTGAPVEDGPNASGKMWAGKGPSEEGAALLARKQAAQAEIDSGNPVYKPYYDITQRSDIPEGTYPTDQNTLTDSVLKTSGYDKKGNARGVTAVREKFDTPEVRARLQAAFDEGSQHPLAKDWYAMRQLHQSFIDELGPEQGTAMFKQRFADPMAMTTGGQSPTDNLLMSAYHNYINNEGNVLPLNRDGTRGLPRNLDGSVASYDVPSPIGGAYAGGNLDLADQLQNTGLSAADHPKRFNFSGNFLGRKNNSTIDEKMMTLFDPTGKLKAPRAGHYGVLESILNDMAAKNGVSPANFQDVAWLAAKRAVDAKGGAKLSEGMPMMEHVNQMLHRTSQITGKSQQEVLRGFINGNMPMYGLGAMTLGGLLQAGSPTGATDAGIEN